jgi:hypothetical protein
MKKVMSLALLASCLVTPVSVSAQTPQTEGFKNRGQCESAFNQLRNDFRKNPETRESAGLAGTGDFNNKDFNTFARTDFECQEQEDGTFDIVFTNAGPL